MADSQKSTRFPNRAGTFSDNDEVLAAELEQAGITIVRFEPLRDRNEVKTSVRGTLHGWEFERAWYYWIASGPGIELAAAERLHAAHGRTVRVEGDCTSPSPRERLHGLACGLYHVDDQEGLNALADTIRGLVARVSESPWITVETIEQRERKGRFVVCMAHIRNNATGEVRSYQTRELLWEEEGHPCTFIWEIGNYGCDCNRALFFGYAAGEKQEDIIHPCGHEGYSVNLENPVTGEVYYREYHNGVVIP